ncbi:RNA recognition motif [Medicago truncatula]|uniref:RNA recognition motif n=1 Tax=Medicago truncatula TaxID=3880 RepID=A0A072U7H5_MEDTR|nr:RNA recognition motif [Medicago truncatula]
MREKERDPERERGGWPLVHPGQARRRYSLSPVERFVGRGRGPSRVPPKGGDGDDWLDARPSRQKEVRQAERGQVRLRESWRHRDWNDQAYQQLRIRDSREVSRKRAIRFSSPIRHSVRNRDDMAEFCFAGKARSGGGGVDRRDLVAADDWEGGQARRGGDVGARLAYCINGKGMVLAGGGKRTQDSGVLKQQQLVDGEERSRLKRFVTFYFTNFPPFLSNFYLRKGFEVCGILEDVIVPSKCNANGDCYGFVRFANVRNVSKLLNAVNDVYFGNYRVRAKLARFDRTDAKVLVREGEDAGMSDVMEGKKGRCAGDSTRVVEGDNTISGHVGKGKHVEVDVGDGRNQLVEVRVGEVKVRLDRGKLANDRRSSKQSVKEDFKSQQKPTIQPPVERQPSIQKLLRMYRSTGEDLQWARSGFLASVINGEAIPVVQTRIEDAGFKDLDVIPLGDDRCGRFLRSDGCSMEKERFDYARILIATSSSEVVNCVEKVFVNGVVVEIRIFEEYGFNIGDDVCLYDHDDGSRSSNSDHDEFGRDLDRDADFLVDNLAKDIVDASKEVTKNTECLGKSHEVELVGNVEHSLVNEGGDDPSVAPPLTGVNQSEVDAEVSVFKDVEEHVPSVVVLTEAKVKRRKSRASSCPPRAARSVESGPWSLEWLSEHHHGDAGVISSARKKVKKVVRPIAQSGICANNRKKVNGVLRHSVISLKKVARLPSKDRSTILHILKSKSRKLQGSDRLSYPKF